MRNVIFVFALICIVGVFSHFHVSEEQRKKIEADVAECQKESGVDQAILDAIKDGKPFTNTRELDCFSACVLKKNGVMKSDGTVNEPRPEASGVEQKCRQLKGKDECETAGKLMECYAKNHLLPKL